MGGVLTGNRWLGNLQLVFCALLAVGFHVALLRLDIPKTSRTPGMGFERLSLYVIDPVRSVVRKGASPGVAEKAKRPAPSRAPQRPLAHASVEGPRPVKEVAQTKALPREGPQKKEKEGPPPRKLEKARPVDRLDADIHISDDFEGYSPPDEVDEGPAEDRTTEAVSLFEGNTVDEGSIHGSLKTRETSRRIGNITYAKPEYERNDPPDYPRIAKRRGYQGRTKLKVEVLETGRVGRLEVVSSSGFDILDEAALAAVKEWHFVPGTENGRHTTQWVIVPVRFNLR